VAPRGRAPHARVRTRALGVATPARFLNETPTVSRTEASTLAVAPETRPEPGPRHQAGREWVGGTERTAIFARGIRVELARILRVLSAGKARGSGHFFRSNLLLILPFLSPMSRDLTSRGEELSLTREFLEFLETSRDRLSLRALAPALSFAFLSFDLLLASRDFIPLWGEMRSLGDAAGGNFFGWMEGENSKREVSQTERGNEEGQREGRSRDEHWISMTTKERIVF